MKDEQYAQVDPVIREEFERLGDVTESHRWTCECADCARFIELGSQIRKLTGDERAAEVLT
jgi:hypothetical protein